MSASQASPADADPPLTGRALARVEDTRLLTGRAGFVHDLVLAGQVQAVFRRSESANADIEVDVTAARAAPGVVAVFTAADLAPVLAPIRTDSVITGMRRITHTALASDRVRLVGDPIALVLAQDRYRAEDAAELIEVRYRDREPLPDLRSATRPGADLLYPEAPGNIAYQDAVSYGRVDEAFDRADRVITRVLHQHRYMAAPLEPRGIVAAYDRADATLTVHAAMHAPHMMRMILADRLGIGQHRIRVRVPDIGGSFGSKWGTSREDLAVCAASVLLGRPVAWVEDRAENLVVGGHAREESLELRLALSADHRLLGLRADLSIDAGAYSVAPMNPAFFTLALRLLLPGPYRIPAYSFAVRTVLTTKGPYVAYRGPWAIESWARETMLDLVARDTGVDPVALRLRNLVGPDEQPYRAAAGYRLSGVSARRTLERAVELADLPTFRRRQRQARQVGRRLLGFGLATFIEPAPGGAEFLAMSGGGTDAARVRVEPDGTVTVFTPQIPHGQGHVTAITQVVGDEFGLRPDQVRVVHSDTSLTPFSSSGTGGSRFATIGLGAIRAAARAARDQVLEVACAAVLGGRPRELEIAEGEVRVRLRPGNRVPLAQIAGMVYLAPAFLPPGAPSELMGSASFDGGEAGFSQATHCCWVEVDAETGFVRVVRYLVVEDCGRIVNPALVDGQIVGGTAQGIGGVLLERVRFDAAGRPLNRGLADYRLPTATDLPNLEIVHLDPPPERSEVSLGVAESGAIGAPPAVTNAIADALDVEITEQSLPPERILELLERSGLVVGQGRASRRQPSEQPSGAHR